jgi:hypothetical protein
MVLEKLGYEQWFDLAYLFLLTDNTLKRKMVINFKIGIQQIHSNYFICFC